jgi:hypothetical protein
MNRRTRSFLPAMLGVAIMMAAMFFGAAHCGAQPITWSGPCTSMTVTNYAACTITFTPWTNFAVSNPTINPGFSATFAVPAGLVVNGMITLAGTKVGNVSPGGVPPLPAPQVPTAGKVTGITLGTPGCCVDVYFDVASCNVYIVPGTPPCMP